MSKRFVSIWFPHLKTDWFTLRRPELHIHPFVLAAPDHGRMVVTATNLLAEHQGINTGMVVADARAILPSLIVHDDIPEKWNKLLTALGRWCIRFTPWVSADLPDSLIFDSTGCAHLWGGEKEYLLEIQKKLKSIGYSARLAFASTPSAAWALSHYGKEPVSIACSNKTDTLLPLPCSALRPTPETLDRLIKLGLRQIKDFIAMPRSVLRRRFGAEFITRLDQLTGREDEYIIPIDTPVKFQERLPCLEPISTASGISIALERSLSGLCKSLEQEQMGLRRVTFTCFRIDGKIQELTVGTHKPTINTTHLFKLFEVRLSTIEPGHGIELFILEAPIVEKLIPKQDVLWNRTCGLQDQAFSELIDRVANRIGAENIHRYIPAEHYWPERSLRSTNDLSEEKTIPWNLNRMRPLHLFPHPQPIEVAAPIPDYPPMLFRYKGHVHFIKKADGPERIERDWWHDKGEHRDYYSVEDEEGRRYWLFRSGHYSGNRNFQWFLHGLFP